MAWTEAPASGESRRSTVIPHAFRHRVSSRLYHSVDFVDGRNIPISDIGRLGGAPSALSRDHVGYLRYCGRLGSAAIGRR